MAKGNNIIVTGEPTGVRAEGVVSGTPKPGTVMEISAIASNGQRTYQVYQPGADGNQRPICVLLFDALQGQLPTVALVSGARCFVYYPRMGEELNMLLADVGGTAAHPILEVLMVDNATGLLIATTGTPESEPFILLEAFAEAGGLAHCLYTAY